MSDTTAGGKGRIVILPMFPVPFNLSSNQPENGKIHDLHPYLNVPNTTVFLVSFIAGSEQSYSLPLADPIFSSNVAALDGYHPDFEVTALACIEGYQYCFDFKNDHVCLPWGEWNRYLYFLFKYFSAVGPIEDMWEIALTAPKVAKLLSIYKHVQYNTLFTNYIKAFTLHGSRLGDPATSANRRLWADEVISWYLKAWFQAQYQIESVVSGANTDFFEGPLIRDGDPLFETQEEADRWSWCSRVLFENGEYTNINFVGFSISLMVMLFIYLTSYANIGWRLIRHLLSKPGVKFFLESLSKLSGLIKFLRLNLFRLSSQFLRPTSITDPTAASILLNTIPNQISTTVTTQRLNSRGLDILHEEEHLRGDDVEENDDPLSMASSLQEYAPFRFI
ncbi:hypothetical protein TWF694_001425 [Orbilia ellipsospora]|uniref:Uncharacterized protein n=1 Tax=Orbilia ellipsospora TaxID=2528407 RepID=A0AAV9XSD8_9PEZI